MQTRTAFALQIPPLFLPVFTVLRSKIKTDEWYIYPTRKKPTAEITVNHYTRKLSAQSHSAAIPLLTGLAGKG